MKRNIFFLILIFLFGYTSFLYAGKINEGSKFPNADAVILLDQKKISFDESGKIVERWHRKVKILDENGRNNFAEVRIRFNKNYEKVNVLRAQTIQPNGNVVATPSNGINVLTIRGTNNAAGFLNLREVVVSFVGITYGSVLDLKMEKISQVLMKDGFWGIEYFGATEPILRKSLILEIPSRLELATKEFGQLKPASVARRSGKKIFNFEMENIPAIKYKENMPPLKCLQSAVVYTTEKNWKQFTRKFIDDYQKAAILTPKIRKKVREITQNVSSEAEKMARIAAYISKRIRMIQIVPEDQNFVPRLASKTYSTRYGSPLDVGVLLHAMMRAANIKADLAFSHLPDRHFCPGLANPAQWNFVLLEISIDDVTKYIPVGREICNWKEMFVPGDLPVQRFKGKSASIIKTPKVNFSDEKNLKTLSAEINDKGLMTGQIAWRVKGIFAPRYCLLSKADSVRNKWLKEQFSHYFKSISLSNWKINNLESFNKPLIIQADFRLKNAAVFQSNFVTIALRNFPFSVFPGGFSENLHRREANNISIPFGEEINYDIKFPKNWAIISPNSGQNYNLKMKFGSYKQSAKIKNQKIEIKKTLVMKKSSVKDFYSTLQNLLQFSNMERNCKILAKIRQQK